MKKNQIQDLVLTSIMAAIILVMTFVPQLGFILVGITELTLIHIPVLIGVFVLPKRYAIALGLIFGLGSMFRAIQVNAGIAVAFINPLVSVLPRLIFVVAAIYIFKGIQLVDQKVKRSDIYIFSFISLVTFIGLFYASQAVADFAGWSRSVLQFISILISVGFIAVYYAFISSKKKESVLYPSVLLLSTFFHTLVVLFSILLFSKGTLLQWYAEEEIVGVLISIAVTNGLAEAMLAVLIGTPIILALKQIKQTA